MPGGCGYERKNPAGSNTLLASPSLCPVKKGNSLVLHNKDASEIIAIVSTNNNPIIRLKGNSYATISSDDLSAAGCWKAVSNLCIVNFVSPNDNMVRGSVFIDMIDMDILQVNATHPAFEVKQVLNAVEMGTVNSL